MTDSVITVENLSKSYLVGHVSAERGRHNYTALRDVITRGAKDFGRKAADMFRGRQVVQGDEVEEFWALEEVSFEVKRGEVLGIIGRNGAGKSTLLKILSRITEPTSGRVQLRGRVASLLEVGTGFHPELTGRENILLNGAILGMTQLEIHKKFDEIVAFAEIERFLDTPVKRYSSGMYVRLAFAVAAHLEPEILVIDEVLAVGDAEFQRKCLGKMHDVSSHEGRTILFVSHNLAAISELATRALLLNAGKVQVDGGVASAISTYLSQGARSPIYERSPDQNSRRPHVRRAEVTTSEPNGVHRFGEPLEIRFNIRHTTPLGRGCFSFQIINQYQQPIIHAFAYYPDVRFGDSNEETTLICRFPSLRLNVGEFCLKWFLSEPPDGETYEVVDSVCLFEVVRTDELILWGWRPEACAYHERWDWTVERARIAEKV
ncbi:MAG: ABC transporter ATP-binding protein [Acidobacteriaceae bacterium]|nr:ABC transporter ATP-binding protein [Acidobacteriaceae bacterium]MBV9976639.1 ABC transporter ATP-binding protein [Hyphomicrobiales bacterium]